MSSAYSRGQVPGMTLQEMQRHVQDEAMERYVQSLERDAKVAAQERRVWGSTVQGSLDEEKKEGHRRREKERENQVLLQRQIEANKSQKAETRKEYIEAASTHSFPLFTETFISEDEVNAWRKQEKEKWREELNQQLVTTKLLRNIEEKKHRDNALRRNEESIANTIRERGIERERLQRQGRELREAWDREVRLKSIKEAIRCGKEVSPTQAVPGPPGRTPAHCGG